MRSYAVSDGRDIKALKIEAILCDALKTNEISGCTILDIGAGSGHIAAHFASRNAVTAADVENQLCVGDANLDFVRLQGVALPFSNASFDVVILNQVLTYVPDQHNELMEIRRILKPAGLCYISLPNRTFPIEPHSKIPFVHYLPYKIYRRAMRWLTGANEEIRMHRFGGMINLFRRSGLTPQDYTVDVLHNPSRYHSGLPFRLPLWKWISRISPTNIFILRVNP